MSPLAATEQAVRARSAGCVEPPVSECRRPSCSRPAGAPRHRPAVGRDGRRCGRRDRAARATSATRSSSKAAATTTCSCSRRPVSSRSTRCPRSTASKGVADYMMLRRKLPDEIFDGRRTLPASLFRRDDVASYLANLEQRARRRPTRNWVSDGNGGRLPPHPASRTPDGPGFVGRAGICRRGCLRAVGARIRHVGRLDAFVHPDAMAAVAASDKRAERAALDDVAEVIESAVAEWIPVDVTGEDSSAALSTPGHRSRRTNVFAALRWTWR